MPDAAERSALLVDFGGVLTTSVTRSFRTVCTQMGLPPELAKEAFLEAYASGHEGDGPVHRMEKGEISVGEFAAGLAQIMSERSGISVPPDGLVEKLFSLMELDEAMFTAVGAARRAGIRTGLLSNSWGSENYPHHRFPELFDTLVISGDVGIRKPDPAIFALAAERRTAPAGMCVRRRPGQEHRGRTGGGHGRHPAPPRRHDDPAAGHDAGDRRGAAPRVAEGSTLRARESGRSPGRIS